MQKFILYTIGLNFLIPIIYSVDVSASEFNKTAREFSLIDQYGKIYEITYPQEKICVLVFADKWGCTQVEEWVRPLYEHYKDTISILGVAQLENVPGWLRSTLVRIFKHKIEFSVMMDWTGNVCRAYEYTGRKADVVIISREGTIRQRFKGKASQRLIEKCWGVIDDLKSVASSVVSPEKPTIEKTQPYACHEGS